MGEHDRPADVSGRHTRLALALLLIAVSGLLAIFPAIRAGGANAGLNAAESTVLGTATVLIALLGIAAALRPGACNRLFGPSRSGPETDRTPRAPPGCTARGFAGHHLDCEAFSSHTIRFGSRIVCAGCTGMVAGGIAGIVLGVARAWGYAPTDPLTDAAMGLSGASLATAGILGAYAKDAKAGTRALTSFLLVTGLVVLAVSLGALGFLPGVFGLAGAVAVLGMRVDLSRLNHAAACAECTSQVATSAAEAGGGRATVR